MAQVHNSTELTAALTGGDTTIELLAGDYAANVTISRGVTIMLGAGVDSEDAKITGQWTINSSAGVTIDGLLFVNETAPTTNTSFNSLRINSAAGVDHVVQNSEFLRDAPDGTTASNPLHYAIYLEGAGLGSSVTIAGNEFHSTNTTDVYGVGNWRAGIWAPSTNNGEITVSNNHFHNVRAGISTGSFDSDWSITDNHFEDVGTGISFGNQFSGLISNIRGNIFGTGIDSELNFRDTAGGVTFAAVSQFDGSDGVYVLGGAGVDTIHYGEAIDTLQAFTRWDADGSGWVANNSNGLGYPAIADEDMFVGIEKIVDANGDTYLLVGSGGYTTIQAAVNAASSGDTIMVAPGTYASFVVNKADLTIIGDGDATFVQGSTGIGIDVAASGLTLQGLKVGGFPTNIELRAVQDITIDDVTISGGTTGIRKATTVSIDDLTITNTTFENLRFGVYFGNSSATPSNLTNVEIAHSTFTDISFKGIYVETLSNALIDHIDMTRVGQFGGPADEPSAYGKHGNGIDLNLKYGDFTDITISNFDFEDVGLSNGNSAIGSHENGAAIAVKIRTDGSYGGANAATFNGAVVIENGTIDGTSTGIRAGEAGSTTAGPDVDIRNVDIINALHTAAHGDIDNQTTGTMKVDTTDYVLSGASDGYIDDGVADVLTVGAGGTYSTITAALAAAHEGDTIQIAAGTYNESVVITVANLTIEGEDGVVIKGTFNADNGAFGGDLSDWIGTQLSYNGSSGAGVTVRADGFTLKDVKIDDFYQGVRFDTDVDDATLTDVDIENSLFGLHKTTTADVIGLTITRGSIVDGYQGTDFTKSTSSLTDGQLKDVNITGTLFQNLSAKGIYTEALADALITGITMTNVGVFGRGDSFGNIGEHGAGIDINLKSGSYSGITIQNFTFTDVGTSNGAGTSHNNAGAITIKARNDAPSYNASPATFTGAVIIRNGTIDGASTGIRVGEEGKTVSGPRVSVTDVKVTDFVDSADHGAFINDTTSPMSVVFTSAGFIFDQGTSSGVINFTPYTAPAPDPEPEEPAPPPPPPPPPPNPGQGPGAQLPDAIVESFDNVTGVDPTSEKASQPTITLPNGEEVPNPIYEEVLVMAELVAQLQAGLISEETVIDKMVEFATDTTAVALQAYQFFTGATPTKEGVAYLVNSDDNENDLTDPYYATFSPDNRYINFAVSLGTGGEGAANFEAQYGQLSFEDAVKSAYDTIIGLDKAEAAGINVTEAIAYVMAQLAYFTALGGSAIGAKAAMVGFLMFAGMNAKVGVYYDGTRGFLADAFNGEADYNVDLTGGAGSGGFTSSGLELGLA